MIFKKLAVCGYLLLTDEIYRYGKLLLVLIWDTRCEGVNKKGPHSHDLKHIHEEVWRFTISVCIGGGALFASQYISWRCFAWSADLQVFSLITINFLLQI